eukprot:5044764-Ditylum_brightwellii.AAC.1
MDTNDIKGGDTNLQKFLIKHDRIDAHEQLHHHCTPPNTHQCRQEQIDYIFITPALAPALPSARFLQFNRNAKCIGTKCKKPSESNPAAQEKYVSTLEQSFKNLRIS